MLKRIAGCAVRACLIGVCGALALATGALLPATSALAGPGDTPVVNGAASRKQHAAAGSFDLPLSLAPANPTTEPRSGPAQAIVFTFDKAVTAGIAVVTEGAASAGDPSFRGNEMIVPLTGVANQQYVTVAVTSVLAADGGTGGHGAVRIGFLLGDVSQNRLVTLSDLEQVHGQVAQAVAASNYLKDVDASGTLSAADEALTNAQLTMLLPAPPIPANQPPHVNAGANQTITLPASASLAGSASDDGLPQPPGFVTLSWSKVSGPGTVTFSNATAAVASATFTAFGSYVLRLTANDGALSNFADVTISATSSSADKMLLTMTGLSPPIEILKFNDGARTSVNTHITGGGAPLPVFQDAGFTALESAAAPLQLAKLAAGTHTTQALLEVRSATTATLLSDWKFEDVQITSFRSTASDLELPRIDFDLAFSQITYRVFNPNGTVAQRMCRNILQNVAC